MEIVDDLLARPLLRVQSGVDHEPDRAEHFILQTSVIVVRVLIEADFLAELLRVQRPPFDIRRVSALTPEHRQIAELLRDRDLHVMSRNTFVIRRRFERDRFLRLRIVCVDIDASRTRSVGRAFVVIGAGRFFLAERLHLHDLELRFRQTSEKFRQLRVHLIFIFLVRVDDLFARLRTKIEILLDGGVERFQIGVAHLLRDIEHLSFDARHFAQSDFVDLVGREIRRRRLPGAMLIARQSVRQRPQSDFRASRGRVDVLHERREFLV